ncbi:hypothetical protein P4J09_15480 [Bacillus cereus]|uniref:hypothetical protein n=1 Tax=unclassified Bacillus cereus group TaxID=2750818 RepID=UPI0022E8E6F8|nr:MULTISPECIES: hypothetical protein [unclassified Bacillus cereus group]MDA1663470.1 hypothetical protein [Bacillus cereus group sp. TH153LC]MDA2771106.1 hypothetical protein [Bacillus cereus group sp. Bc010]MEB9379436.1 hypothetical protein [Bacillus cereus]
MAQNVKEQCIIGMYFCGYFNKDAKENTEGIPYFTRNIEEATVFTNVDEAYNTGKKYCDDAWTIFNKIDHLKYLNEKK